jgi:zinc transporter, ZIP family
MIEFLNNVSPILLAFIATLFTYSVTAIGAALVFIFKKINKNVMDAMLGFAAGVMIAASYFSLLSPARDMAESLNMNVTLVLFISFFSGGLLLYIGDKLFNLFDKKLSKKTLIV